MSAYTQGYERMVASPMTLKKSEFLLNTPFNQSAPKDWDSLGTISNIFPGSEIFLRTKLIKKYR